MFLPTRSLGGRREFTSPVKRNKLKATDRLRRVHVIPRQHILTFTRLVLPFPRVQKFKGGNGTWNYQIESTYRIHNFYLNK